MLLCTEGTYPFVGGGVSTWCDMLCRELEDVRFAVYAVTGQPEVRLRYELPPNAREVIHVPLWGSSEPTLEVRPELDSWALLRRKRETTKAVLEAAFVPLLRRLVRAIAGEGEPAEHGEIVHELWRYFQRYDWMESWKSPLAWETFLEEVSRERGNLAEPEAENPTLADLRDGLRGLYNHLLPLNVSLPEVDLAHSTLAGFAGLAAVVAKRERGIPFLLTEHGVWVRERYLAMSQAPFSVFAKRFLMRLSTLVARLNYYYADLICPVANYNRRWELPYGAAPSSVRSIYNGVDPALFSPAPKPSEHAGRPVVIVAARVFPLKDLETMIRAAAIVRDRISDVLYLIYGSLDADVPYVERCRALIAQLGVEDCFVLRGFHRQPAEVYAEGDVTALSSVSEGFPYTVLESMACARPVVATDVGGVREALQGYGLIVPPRDHVALAAATIRLLEDNELRLTLGRQSREAVLARFRSSHCVSAYRAVYAELAPDRRTGATA